MTIKMIATDMDGTFLKETNDYNRDRFADLYAQMQAQNIYFVPISGNQFYQIQSFFPNQKEELTIVGENGAFIAEQGKVLQTGPLSQETVRVTLDYLKDHHFYDQLLIGGVQSAYIWQEATAESKTMFAKYFHRIKEVANFDHLPEDDLLKFSFNTDEEKTQNILADLNSLLGNQVAAVTSGHGNIDIMRHDVNKGTALEYLLDRYDLNPSELVTFGDGGNDVEMLKLADHSFAMENASAEAKQAAKFTTDSNQEEGVLNAIESLLAKQA
ncbi:Cof-type HAD-IIB family hydrolase [Aerococcus kribbianus]|uniref:Cof-type HAD-IIB family hydrolase n=1 Tax=Aerococcus kribbianus TaxID=2999064 RepID=A0A9X3JFA2_9LACT|nr:MULTISPECIES: Cof-type HAD-IIB family hydrolase [unclassified Aerococcus]MCZ0717408.1 Cof-type HAD-IIB family hydrolase [Aerococcus sp. YH-aer221]MCZ0725696.1 Cof-type HAD-IIB family hydrolase [Aerococcus sp. YH-aer222]